MILLSGGSCSDLRESFGPGTDDTPQRHVLASSDGDLLPSQRVRKMIGVYKLIGVHLSQDGQRFDGILTGGIEVCE